MGEDSGESGMRELSSDSGSDIYEKAKKLASSSTTRPSGKWVSVALTFCRPTSVNSVFEKVF